MIGSMKDREYQVMADVENVHWWYRGLRDLISRVLQARGFTERSELRVLDAGCGTGENLRMLRDQFRIAYLGGFDPSALALDLARRKVPEADLYQSDLCQPELRAEEYDLVLNCDVLCITGLESARDGMRRIAQRIRPGGLLIVNLPAFQWLYSRHDQAVGTRRRFTATEIRSFLESLGLRVELLTYRLWTLFPAILLTRLPSMLFRPRTSVQSDLSIPNPWISHCLTRVLAWENRAILRGVRFPWGSSVFASASR